MASVDLKAELECSVCLDTYTDPVMLKCGHNFCKKCIHGVQTIQGVYSCPECRQKFQELHSNLKLRNIVEILSSQKSGVLCSIHEKVLEYYCTEDDACVCVSCCLVGEHKGHKMESLEEASGKKKEKVKNVLQKLLTHKEKIEETVSDLQKRRINLQVKADGDTAKVTELFRDLWRQMKVLEEKTLNKISRHAKHVSRSIMKQIQELETKKKDLSGQIRDIEELCNKMDPLTVLQTSDIGNLCDTEDDHNEDSLDKLLQDAGQMDMAKISQKIQTGLSNIMAGVRVQTPTNPNFTKEDEGHVIETLSERVPQPTLIMEGPQHPEGPSIQTVLQMLGLSKDSDITLDINTAGNDLCISDNMKTVTWSIFSQKYPERAERFQSAQVLSTQSFSLGQHYWEVDVAGSKVWSVGMCYRSIERRGHHSDIGWNNKSWALHKSWLSNQYSVIYDRNWVRLHGKVSSNRVMIYLDYDAGQISFYDLCDPIQHLYTFNATFIEPLHAVLWVGGGCIKIVREKQVKGLSQPHYNYINVS